ncbi:MAG: class I SAM-dependent methyltransferase [Bacteroidales bacterium]|nr:class I SAM-dependent methyltransferase [Bacteroidales bacterium]
MRELWNARYNSEEYVYGVSPNLFFESQLLNYKPGNLLLPAEGEGRNAVFAASLSWKVYAFDFSEEARRKALKLANKNKVLINYALCSFDDIEYDEAFFDCIALIYAHQPSEKRKIYHQKLLKYLKPGGTIILEAFSKKQVNFDTGGPKNIDMLFSLSDLECDFNELSSYDIKEERIFLEEGLSHTGMASIVRMIGTK